MTQSRRLDRVTVHPLFADVLSGEFLPPSDPLNRVHRLGRLAFAAFEKGELSSSNYFKESFAYTPSWASSVRANTFAEYEFDANRHFISGLGLVGAEDDTLFVDFVVGNSNNPFVQISGDGYEGHVGAMALELGSGLDEARDLVTRAATAFFNRNA